MPSAANGTLWAGDVKVLRSRAIDDLALERCSTHFTTFLRDAGRRGAHRCRRMSTIHGSMTVGVMAEEPKVAKLNACT